MSERGSGGRLLDVDAFSELGLSDQQRDRLWSLSHRYRPSEKVMTRDEWQRLCVGIFRIAQLQNAKTRSDTVAVVAGAAGDALKPILAEMQKRIEALEAQQRAAGTPERVDGQT